MFQQRSFLYFFFSVKKRKKRVIHIRIWNVMTWKTPVLHCQLFIIVIICSYLFWFFNFFHSKECLKTVLILLLAFNSWLFSIWNLFVFIILLAVFEAEKKGNAMHFVVVVSLFHCAFVKFISVFFYYVSEVEDDCDMH